MITLEEQLNQLIEQAPDHGVSLAVMQQAIAPVIEGVARSLHHTHYYICQSSSGQWVSTVLQRDATTKAVIYAYGDRATAEAAPNQTGTPFVIQPIPVANILFQLISLKPIDSLLFVETSHPKEKITEIKRTEFEKAIQKSLKKLRSPSNQTYLA